MRKLRDFEKARSLVARGGSLPNLTPAPGHGLSGLMGMQGEDNESLFGKYLNQSGQ